MAVSKIKMNTLTYQMVFEERKANTTTNWFPSNNTLTLQKRALVCVEGTWASARVQGIAYGPNNTNPDNIFILSDLDGGTSQKLITVLDAGTYYIWLRLANTGNGSRVRVYKLFDLE